MPLASPADLLACVDPTHDEWVQRYAAALIVVRATDLERYTLHEQLSGSTGTPVDWVNLRWGTTVRVGELAGHPIVICISWECIAGTTVAFYYSTSNVVDWEMIESWIQATFVGAHDFTNASNFALPVHGCPRLIIDFDAGITTSLPAGYSFGNYTKVDIDRSFRGPPTFEAYKKSNS